MNTIEQSSLSVSLNKNLQRVKEQFDASSDLKIRRIQMKDDVIREAVILYVDGITDTQNMQENILSPLLQIRRIDSIEGIVLNHLSVMDVSVETTFDKILTGLSKGKAVVLIDGFNEGILADSSDWRMRAVTEPSTQSTTNGPMVAFTEQSKVNLNLLRNMIQTSDFKVETIQVGRKSKTDVSIVYLDEFVDKCVLEEAREKIKKIDVTYILELSVIEDAIEEKTKLFPLVHPSERPDVTVSSLFEGRIAIFLNGSPFALIVPTLFFDFFQKPDEYYSKAGRFSFRMMRIFSWILSNILLGVYVTMVRFHHDWLPSPFDKKLLTESDTLFPILMEVLFLLFLFQLLMEASVRIPKSIVLLISLIGAIVVGETSVTAKLIHPLTLIVVGVNFLASIAISAGGLWRSVLTLRMLFLLAGYFFGLKGIVIGMVILIVYMASLKSLGVPYLAPFIPFRPKEMKDAFIRGDLRKLINSKHTYPHKDKK